MLTLQKSIRSQSSTFDAFELEVQIPKFEYDQTPNAEGYLRSIVGHTAVRTTAELRVGRYRVSVPTAPWLGDSAQATYDFYRYHHLEPRMTDSIDPYTIPITIRATPAGTSAGIDVPGWTAIYGERVTDARLLRTRNLQRAEVEKKYGTRHQPNEAAMTRVRVTVERDGFLINKAAYDAIADRIRATSAIGADNPIFLLALVELMVALDDRGPHLREDVAGVRPFMVSLLRESEVQQPEAVLAVIERDFAELFEFPVVIPELSLVKIKGHMSSSTSEPLTSEDLRFYDLSAETVDAAGRVTILRWDWPPDAMTGGRAAFDLTGTQPLIEQAIVGPVVVAVNAFDGATLWRRELAASDPILADLDVRVLKYLPASVSSEEGSTGGAVSKRLRGKVVSLTPGRVVEGLVVVVQAQATADATTWKTVGSAETDRSGNFSLGYPYGSYVRARALVSASPGNPADLEIVAGATAEETISDEFIYLLLSEEPRTEDTAEEDDEECGCGRPLTAKRLPDQADLISSDEYTQDIGGTCLNLSTPNRTLREYAFNAIVRTSDPDVANYTLHKAIANDGRVAFTLQGGTRKLARGVVDLDNPIRWQDAPDADAELSFYQAVTVATGHILHYKSQFKADGYSLGDLLYSLPLAPGQKKEIVVFESAHSLTGAESQTISQGEQLSAELISDRMITDQLSGGIDEALRGQSEASTAGVSAGLGVSASYGGIGGSLGVAGGYSNSNSSASQNSSRNIAQSFGEKLRQSLLQNAESYRRLNAQIVTTVTERQDYGVTSEVVANHNHCHSLTMMYFEVLRHYAIFQELSHVEECVFVPLLFTSFSIENIHRYKDILARRLLPLSASTYLQPGRAILFGRQHPLIKAFDAIDRIKTNYARVDYPPAGETYADGRITFLQGDLDLRVDLPRPKTNYDRIKSLPLISKTVTTDEVDVMATMKGEATRAALGALTGGLSLLFGGGPTVEYKEKEIIVRQAIFDQFMSLDANYQTVPPARCIRVRTFTPTAIPTPFGTIPITGDEFFPEGSQDKVQWTAYATLMGYANVYAFLNEYFAGRLISEWDDIFENDILPLVFEKIVDSLRITGLGLDFAAQSKYKGRERRMRIRLRGTTSHTRRDLANMGPLTFSSSSPNVRALRLFSLVILERLTVRYSTAHFEGTLFSANVGDDVLDSVALPVPLTAREKIDPRKEDSFIANELIEHLNSNVEHYNKVLFRGLDPDRRFMLLDGFTIEIFDRGGNSLGFRSLASVVKNEVITTVGNTLVLPVAAGYRVSRGFIVEDDGAEVETPLFEHYKPFTPVPPYRLSVPTKGVFMEAVQGSCDACELVKENSSQDWDRFRPDEPTPITPVVTPTPVVTEYKPQYKDFASPLVSVQAAPSLPAPAAGLAALGELLGKSGVFTDVTGLQGNQRNVLETYLSNQANAKAFAEMSKSLVSQQHNTANSTSFMRQASQAREEGAITQDDYQQLTRAHLQQQIDGGESTRETAQFEREQARTSLADVASAAAGRGQAVEAERTDLDGTRESVRLASFGVPPNIQCGFFGQGAPVTKSDLISRIQQVAGEANNTFFQFGNLGAITGAYFESDADMFKHLCVYSLGNRFQGGSTSPQLFNDVRDALLAYSGLTASSSTTTVAAAINTTVGGGTGVEAAIRAAINQAKQAANDTFPWSAVFIVYCVRQAAVDLGIEWHDGTSSHNVGKLLDLATAHAQYGHVAYERRQQGIRGTYHAFAPADAVIEVGDIIIQDRRQNTDATADCYAASLTTANIRTLSDLAGGTFGCTHGDLVTDLDAGTAITIGGNLHQSVRRRRYPLTTDGHVHIDNTTQQIYTQEDDSGQLAATTTSSAGGVPDRTTSRVFAVLKLVEECGAGGGVPVSGGILV